MTLVEIVRAEMPALIEKILPGGGSRLKMVERIEEVREAIRDEVQLYVSQRKRELAYQFENAYKKKFAESLPSLKMPPQLSNSH